MDTVTKIVAELHNQVGEAPRFVPRTSPNDPPIEDQIERWKTWSANKRFVETFESKIKQRDRRAKQGEQ